MENLADTEPQLLEIKCKTEAIQEATADYLLATLPPDQRDSVLLNRCAVARWGPKKEWTEFHYVRAFCTPKEFEAAYERAVIECITNDRDLIDAGLLPEWPGGPNRVPLEDYSFLQ